MSRLSEQSLRDIWKREIYTKAFGTTNVTTGTSQSEYSRTERSDVLRIPYDDDGFRRHGDYFLSSKRQSGPYGKWFRDGRQDTVTTVGNLYHETNTSSMKLGWAPTLRFDWTSAAEVKAYNALQDLDVNLAQAFAERKQTSDFIGGTATRIAKAANLAKKGRWLDAMGLLKPKRPPRHRNFTPRSRDSRFADLSSDRVLEFNYAAKPLISDVLGSCDALAEIPKSSYLVTTRGQVKDKISKSVKDNEHLFMPMTLYYEEEQRTQCVLNFVPRNQLIIALSSLGLTNPALLAYEMARYSFVLDWMLPLGDWIQALNADDGYTWKGGCLTTMSKSRVKFGDCRGGGGWPTSESTKVSGYRRCVEMRRYAYVNKPFPTYPRLENPFSSSTRVINGLALLTQAFR